MTVHTLTETLDSHTLSLDPRGSGRFLVKIIDVGEGSSAEYTEAALVEAERQRIFPAGTHMYLDHAGPERRGPHGERSVKDLASVLTQDARYDADMRALVAEAQAMDGYQHTLEALAPHVGLSIRANAEVDPPARAGGKPIVTRFLTAESVDWVSRAGRGGQVLAILESAGVQVQEATSNDRREQLDRAVITTYRDRDRDIWASLADFDEAASVAYFRVGTDLYSQTFTVAEDDLSVSLTGPRTEVRAVTTYVPAAASAGVIETAPITQEEGLMPTIDQAELDRLHAQEAALADATKRAEEAEAKLTEAALAKTIAEAREQVATKVAETAKDLPAPMIARITHQVQADITESLPADIDARITAAVEAERTYLTSVTESEGLKGFGQAVAESTAPAKRTHNAFGRKIQEV